MEGITEHHSVMWIVPNLDIVAPRFHLCAGVADKLPHIYPGTGSLGANAARS